MDFIFDDDDMMDEYEEELNKERANKYKNLFYRYSGIEPGTKLTEADIRNNWNTGFMRIRAFENCSENELLEALLNSSEEEVLTETKNK